MNEVNSNKRYQIRSFRANSLLNNPINSPIERKLAIYLPPDYFESEKHYPVIYFIHGYTGNIDNLSITPKWDDNKNLPIDLIPPEILKMVEVDNITSYVKIDELITKLDWPPFILVQPDASLYLPHYLGHKEITGDTKTKGSFYINSPFTGNFADLIIKDVIEYIDGHYRTIPNNQKRGLVGTSMGGYGAFYLSLHYPDKFIACVALSPANMTLRLLTHEMISPLNELMLGKEEAINSGKTAVADICDTFDLITSKDNPITKFDNNGDVGDINDEGLRKWEKFDLNNIMKEYPESFKKVNLLFNCHIDDQYGFAEEAKKLHETLVNLGIDHQFEIYDDPRAKLEPHTLGTGYHILPALKYCNQFFI